MQLFHLMAQLATAMSFRTERKKVSKKETKMFFLYKDFHGTFQQNEMKNLGSIFLPLSGKNWGTPPKTTEM